MASVANAVASFVPGG